MKVNLRTEYEDDWPWLWHWRHELDNAEWKQWDSPFLHDHIRRLSYEEFKQAQVLNTRFGSIIEADGQRVGTVNRSELPPRGGGWWDIGIVIYDPTYRNQGIGTEAGRLWIDHTFNHTRAHVVTLSTWSGNEPMIKTGERLGLKECSRIPEARSWKGLRYDVVQMSVLRADWEKQRLDRTRTR